MPVSDSLTAIRDCPALVFTRGQIFAGAWKALSQGFLRGLKQTRIYRTPEPDGRDAPASSTQIADYITVDAAASRPTLPFNNPAAKTVRQKTF